MPVVPRRLLDDCRAGLYNPRRTGSKWGAGGDGRVLRDELDLVGSPLVRVVSAAFCRQQEGGSGLAQPPSARAAAGRSGKGGVSPPYAGGL
jgi:hypothetical protein